MCEFHQDEAGVWSAESLSSVGEIRRDDDDDVPVSGDCPTRTASVTASSISTRTAPTGDAVIFALFRQSMATIIVLCVAVSFDFLLFNSL